MTPESLDFIDLPLLGMSQIQLAALDVETLDIESGWLSFEAPISAYRREHALKYIQKADRQRSLGATLLLDYLLRQQGLKEQEMEYSEGTYGKPFFKNHPELHFSLSHSGKYALCALSPFPVGIDIEQVRPYHPSVAALCMNAEELAQLAVLSPNQQAETFTICWCLKEALLKATGTGMMEDTFPVILKKDGVCKPSDLCYADFLTHTFRLEDYMGAVAYRRR